MSDLETRELERRAAAGDARAIAHLNRSRARVTGEDPLERFDTAVARLIQRTNADAINATHAQRKRDRITRGHVAHVVLAALEHGAAAGEVHYANESRGLVVAVQGAGPHTTCELVVGLGYTKSRLSLIWKAIQNVWPSLGLAFMDGTTIANRTLIAMTWAKRAPSGSRAKTIRASREVAETWARSCDTETLDARVSLLGVKA